MPRQPCLDVLILLGQERLGALTSTFDVFKVFKLVLVVKANATRLALHSLACTAVAEKVALLRRIEMS